jgi:hypothetical protein
MIEVSFFPTFLCNSWCMILGTLVASALRLGFDFLFFDNNFLLLLYLSSAVDCSWTSAQILLN